MSTKKTQPKQRKLKNLKDNASFKFNLRKSSPQWKVISKSKGIISVQSQCGYNRIVKGDRLVYPV